MELGLSVILHVPVMPFKYSLSLFYSPTCLTSLFWAWSKLPCAVVLVILRRRPIFNNLKPQQLWHQVWDSNPLKIDWWEVVTLSLLQTMHALSPFFIHSGFFPKKFHSTNCEKWFFLSLPLYVSIPKISRWQQQTSFWRKISLIFDRKAWQLRNTWTRVHLQTNVI